MHWTNLSGIWLLKGNLHWPSFAILATDDGTINPVLERSMYNRAGCVITEMTGGHTLFMTKPEEVTKVIIEAAEKSATA